MRLTIACIKTSLMVTGIAARMSVFTNDSESSFDVKQLDGIDADDLPRKTGSADSGQLGSLNTPESQNEDLTSSGELSVSNIDTQPVNPASPEGDAQENPSPPAEEEVPVEMPEPQMEDLPSSHAPDMGEEHNPPEEIA